jgi:pyridoxamine 5'-phosphate oxidase
MGMSITHSRIDYVQGELTEAQVPDEPWTLLATWVKDAETQGALEPHAMTFCTIDEAGFPTGRVVLLRELTAEGLTFYTNRESAKGQAIARDDRASCTFFWPSLERQVRIRGRVAKVSDPVSDAYFASRPRESQLGAWASPQSQVLRGRDELEARFAEIRARFEGQPVPRPPFWGGYLLRPERYEFWQGRRNRLHDRVVFESKGTHGFTKQRLAP